MAAYEVSQVFLRVGTVYQVRKPHEEDILYTVRGELMSPSPAFHLVEGDSGKEVGQLTGNFLKTKYEIRDEEVLLASLVFPSVAFKKTLTLTIGNDVFDADGGVFRGVYQCKTGTGDLVLEIAKELSIRDIFSVRTNDVIPYQVALLSAVAIHSRFYEMV